MAKGDNAGNANDSTANKDPDAPLGEGGYKALLAERERANKLEAELKEARATVSKLEADANASKTDLDKANERLDKLEERAQKAEYEVLLSTVASEKGLTPAQAKWLKGSTKDELTSSADDLLASFKAEPGKAPAVTSEPSAGSKDVPVDYNALAARIST